MSASRKSTYYMLRVQTRPELTPEQTASRLLGIVKETGADEICLFAFSEERNDGHPSLAEVTAWCERTRPARAALAEAGVRISVNPWLTLLHADRGRRLRPDQPWQTLVDPFGRPAAAQVCPLDPDWRVYYREVLRCYAAEEEVDLVWVEDDIRLHNHAPLAWGGCFCEAHLARFAARVGYPVSRASLVAACLAPGEPHPWRALWLDTWDAAQLELVESWREVVESAGARLGLMSSLLAQHSAEGRRWSDWFRAIDPGGAPAHRPHFWPYGSGTPETLPAAVAQLDATRATQPAAARSLPEIENAPYGRWNKSYREIFGQMALAHVLGSSGLAVSLHDFVGNDPDDEPEKAAFLRRVRPALELLARVFPGELRTAGVGVPWSPDAARRVRLDSPGADWQALAAPVGGFARWLMAAGAAVTLRAETRVNAVSASAVWAAPDASLERWLAGGLLLSGPAALALQHRGYGSLTGLTDLRLVSQDDVAYSFERCVDPRFGLRADADISLNWTDPGTYCHRLAQGTLTPGAQQVSALLDARGTPVGHGLVIYENQLGGRVATVPWNSDAPVVMNEQRAAQLPRTLDWLAGASSGHLAVSGHPWLIPIALTDGRRWRIAVFNASPDDCAGFAIRLPYGEPAAALHLAGTGELAPAEYRDGQVTTASPLRQWELVVLFSERTAG